jgi:uncharacterized protein (DUF2126 family)
MERNRLRRIFSQGLDAAVGYVLPLQPIDPPEGKSPVSTGTQWQTGRWFVRDERMYLMPGDSPMGWRLPLDSLPWAAPTERWQMIEQDPFSPHLAQRGALPSKVPVTLQPRHVPAQTASVAPQKFESDPSVVRTALCVEVRDPNRANGPKAEADAMPRVKSRACFMSSCPL